MFQWLLLRFLRTISSSSTGQAEFISKPESKNINPPYKSHSTHPDTENSVTNSSATSQINSSLATVIICMY